MTLLFRILPLMFCLMATTIFSTETETTTASIVYSGVNDIFGRGTSETPNQTPLDVTVYRRISSPATGTSADAFLAEYNLVHSLIIDNPDSMYSLLSAGTTSVLDMGVTANFEKLKSILGSVQALQANISYAPASYLITPDPTTVDTSGETTGIPNGVSFNNSNYIPTDKTVMILLYVLNIFIQSSIGYTTDAEALNKVIVAGQIVSYLIQAKTAEQVAEIDAASNNTSDNLFVASFFRPSTDVLDPNYQNSYVISLCCSFSKDNWSTKESRFGYLTVDADGSLRCNKDRHYSKSSFFKPSGAGGKNIYLSSCSIASPSNYLSDPGFVALNINSSWDMAQEKVASRIMATGSLDAGSRMLAAPFLVNQVSDDVTSKCLEVFPSTSRAITLTDAELASPKAFNLTSVNSGGILFNEPDPVDKSYSWYVRSYNSTPQPYLLSMDIGGGKTRLSNIICIAEPVDSFVLALANVVDAVGIVAQLQAFNALYSSGVIRTRPQLTAALIELELIFKKASSLQSDWQLLVSQYSAITPTLISIRRNFFTSWPAAPETGTLSRVLGLNSKNPGTAADTDANQLAELKEGELYKLYVFKNFSTTGSFSEKVNSLMTRFSTLDEAGVGPFLKDVEDLVLPAKWGGTFDYKITSTDKIVEAYPEDIAKLTKADKTGILDNGIGGNSLANKSYFQRADSKATPVGSFSSRLNNLVKALNIPISVETYLANLNAFVRG